MMWPAEWLIRIFKGSYPNLNLPKNYTGKKILDVGCGDGRNLLFLKSLGFKIYGTEISQEIVKRVRENLKMFGIVDANIVVGTNAYLPFENDFFDYIVSWNVIYYMSSARGFEKHVKEHARVAKEGVFDLVHTKIDSLHF